MEVEMHFVWSLESYGFGQNMLGYSFYLSVNACLVNFFLAYMELVW
jgi:hypothetical protein